MKTLILTILTIAAVGTLAGQALAQPASPGGVPAGDGERRRPPAVGNALGISSFSAIARRNLLRGTVANNGSSTVEVGYAFAKVVRRRLIPLASGKIAVPAGQTVTVSARLNPETTSGLFRLAISDPSGKVVDTKYAALSSGTPAATSPYAVTYRTLRGARVVLSSELVEGQTARTAAEQTANTRSSFLKSCGFACEVQSVVDDSNPDSPASLFRVVLYAQLEQAQTRRFSSLEESQRFADQIKSCNPQNAGGQLEVQIVSELEQRREQREPARDAVRPFARTSKSYRAVLLRRSK